MDGDFLAQLHAKLERVARDQAFSPDTDTEQAAFELRGDAKEHATGSSARATISIENIRSSNVSHPNRNQTTSRYYDTRQS